MTTFTERITLPNGSAYTEIIEDEALAEIRNRGESVTFRVLQDEWSDDAETRRIIRAEVMTDE